MEATITNTEHLSKEKLEQMGTIVRCIGCGEGSNDILNLFNTPTDNPNNENG